MKIADTLFLKNWKLLSVESVTFQSISDIFPIKIVSFFQTNLFLKFTFKHIFHLCINSTLFLLIKLSDKKKHPKFELVIRQNESYTPLM